jgi:hypothetical protein
VAHNGLTLRMPLVPAQGRLSVDTAGALALDWVTCRAVLTRPLRKRMLHPGPRCLTIVPFEGAGFELPLMCPHCGSRVA